MEKNFIQNRKGQRIAVLLEAPIHQKGLAFVMHGLGGFKEQPHLQTVAAVLQNHNYTVIRFDTTNSFGESEGNYEDATVTNYYKDLEDVIQWAQTQSWYQEPFVLAGHSLGAMCVTLYAEHYPKKVRALAPLATVISGKLSIETPKHKAILEEWKRTGWREEKSASKPGIIKRLKWSHMEDRLKYDLLPHAAKLTMPVILIVGSQDTSCPPEYQKLLYNALPGFKELHVIPGAPHTYVSPDDLAQVKKILNRWLERF